MAAPPSRSRPRWASSSRATRRASRCHRATRAALKSSGVDVDDELMGGDGTVPLLFGFRDSEGNNLMVVQEQAGG